MAPLAFVFAATWVVSTGMAAHLPRLLQAAGASASGTIAAAALVGPAQVAARLIEFGLMRRVGWCMNQEFGRTNPQAAWVRRCGRQSGFSTPVCG